MVQQSNILQDCIFFFTQLNTVYKMKNNVLLPYVKFYCRRGPNKGSSTFSFSTSVILFISILATVEKKCFANILAYFLPPVFIFSIIFLGVHLNTYTGFLPSYFFHR